MGESIDCPKGKVAPRLPGTKPPASLKKAAPLRVSKEWVTLTPWGVRFRYTPKFLAHLTKNATPQVRSDYVDGVDEHEQIAFSWEYDETYHIMVELRKIRGPHPKIF